MNVSPRLLWAGMLAVFCCLDQGSAQSAHPENPLRRPPKAAAAAEPKAEPAPEPEPEPVAAAARADQAIAAAGAQERQTIRSTSYERDPRQARRGFSSARVPTRARRVTESAGSAREEITGEIIIEGIPEGVPNELPEEIVVNEGWADCCGGSGCADCCVFPCPTISLDDFEVFAGVQGFTGPKNTSSEDGSGTGSFGFDVGFNWGRPFPCTQGCLGMQFGLRSVHSNFSGAAFTREGRNQLFLTGGMYRRVDWGLQGGLVVDYLFDSWYTETDLVQLRGEVSWVYPHEHELGFWWTAHTQSDTQPSLFSGNSSSISETWEATDLYAFFYRKRFCDTATGRFFAGFSNDSDGLIGADLRVPLHENWALESGFAYLVPEQARTGRPGGGHEQESWNVGINLVWYPGCRSALGNDYFRPLFNVADNGSFMVDRR